MQVLHNVGAPSVSVYICGRMNVPDPLPCPVWGAASRDRQRATSRCGSRRKEVLEESQGNVDPRLGAG